MTPRRAAALLVLAGELLLVVGVGLIYLPAGIIVAGVSLAFIGRQVRENA